MKDDKEKTEMKKRKIGNSEMFVHPVGLGCMGFSHASGEPVDSKTAVKILRQAYEMGIEIRNRK